MALVAQAQFFGNAGGNPGYAVIVGASVRIALGNGSPERIHHRDVGIQNLQRLAFVVGREVHDDRVDHRAT